MIFIRCCSLRRSTGWPGPIHPGVNARLGCGYHTSGDVALASLKDVQESFDLARRTAARPFEAEKAHIELLNASETVESIPAILIGMPLWLSAKKLLLDYLWAQVSTCQTRVLFSPSA